MEDFVSITYIGKKTLFNARCGNRTYEFEWHKGLGIGKRKQEVRPEDAQYLANMRDKRGRYQFLLERYDIINKED